MAYLCVDKRGEFIANEYPEKGFFEWEEWRDEFYGDSCTKGTIKKLIGKEMSWEDEPICLEEFMYLNGEM